MHRRSTLRAGAAALAALAAPSFAFAQPQRFAARLRLVQLLDPSPTQQEVTRDYAAGLRLALDSEPRRQELALQIDTLPCECNDDDVARALRSVRDDARVVGLIGTAGEALALATTRVSRELELPIAHLAPWLWDARFDADDRLFGIFASRERQMEHALTGLAGMGVKRIAVIYADASLEASLGAGIDLAAKELRLETVRFTAPTGQDATAVERLLPASAPAVVLFVGGTIELAMFTQELERRRLQRYVVGSSDVNLVALQQIGVGKGVPVIVTQVVPNARSSNAPLVMAYREALKRLLDEAPSPSTLAGYVAGRYALKALEGIPAQADRPEVLRRLQRRTTVDLDGYRVAFDAGGARGSRWVNLAMLRADGRLIG